MLDLFDETAVLRGDDQRELTEGGGNSEPAQLSCKVNVATEFHIKGDDTKKSGCWRSTGRSTQRA